jgi:hypothetical protein
VAARSAPSTGGKGAQLVQLAQSWFGHQGRRIRTPDDALAEMGRVLGQQAGMRLVVSSPDLGVAPASGFAPSVAMTPAAAAVMGGWVVLGGQGSDSRVAPMALPIAARPLPPGTPAAATGGRILVLDAQGALVAEPSSGRSWRPLAATAAAVARDGALAWTAGPGGLAVVDLAAARLVETHPWPAGTPAEAGGGVTGYATDGLLDATSEARRPPVGLVAEGLLVVPAGPGRIAGIAGAGP